MRRSSATSLEPPPSLSTRRQPSVCESTSVDKVQIGLGKGVGHAKRIGTAHGTSGCFWRVCMTARQARCRYAWSRPRVLWEPSNSVEAAPTCTCDTL
eukprot:1734874-Alexandrium_andersonii.AAC.1